MYTPGAVVVIRGGDGVAGRGGDGMIRAPSVAKLVRIAGEVATVQRTRGRNGRFPHWAKPLDLPLDAIVREATRRELVLGYPAPEGPPLLPVTR
jgi:hypothetical protein